MKDSRNLIIGVVLLLVGIAGLSVLPGNRMFAGGMMQMMGGNMMMDRDGMKAMMKDMMGAKLPPGMNPNDLPEATSDGAQLLGQYCTLCHEMPGPGMHSAKQWPPVVDRMNQRMQMMSGRGMMRMMQDIKAPTDTELQTLIAYLQKHAQRAIDKTQYKDLDTTEGQLFTSTCSQCHALPEPKQHTADEWPTVVERMTRNMDVMGKPIPKKESLKTIVAYLQKHAKQ